MSTRKAQEIERLQAAMQKAAQAFERFKVKVRNTLGSARFRKAARRLTKDIKLARKGEPAEVGYPPPKWLVFNEPTAASDADNPLAMLQAAEDAKEVVSRLQDLWEVSSPREREYLNARLQGVLHRDIPTYMQVSRVRADQLLRRLRKKIS